MSFASTFINAKKRDTARNKFVLRAEYPFLELKTTIKATLCPINSI